jgi:hypothetical protein
MAVVGAEDLWRQTSAASDEDRSWEGEASAEDGDGCRRREDTSKERKRESEVVIFPLKVNGR